ncbi:Potassium transporter 5 [Capsicum baccatum]|uniref:Potassium transporter 5 n=1 Tax=Capsicum baccatum TaxID=33114 RepID=A0A2G2W052_CAPBA|nr:Potassium transporter 5 [Capsicum baccatum]
MFQRFGTEKVGYTFAPILCLWFVMIAGIGIYNFSIYDATIIRALNPVYIVRYFQRDAKAAWISLGGVVMCITGAEALFADVGHFNVRSVQISMCFVTYPALILAYLGQGAYLTKHPENVSNTFYASLPKSIYWFMFTVAVLAAIIASQALITGTFAIIQQSLALGCFPRVKIVHTSIKHHGQIYIPEINTLLMIACVLTTIGFKNTDKLSNAYGSKAQFSNCALTFQIINRSSGTNTWVNLWFLRTNMPSQKTNKRRNINQPTPSTIQEDVLNEHVSHAEFRATFTTLDHSVEAQNDHPTAILANPVANTIVARIQDFTRMNPSLFS